MLSSDDKPSMDTLLYNVALEWPFRTMPLFESDFGPVVGAIVGISRQDGN